VPEPGAFRERLLLHARDRGGAPALVGRDAVVSYGELPGAVEALAAALRALGIARGATVALTARREVDHMLAVLALLDLGASQVALASHDPRAMRERLAKRVGATVVLGDAAGDAVAGLPWIGLPAAFARARSAPSGPREDAFGETSARLHFTGSGTTGDPKIVAYAPADLAAHASSYPSVAGHRVLRPAHVEYNNSKRTRLTTLWQGGTSVFSDGSTESLRGQCLRHDVSWLELSPLHGADLVAACRAEGALPGRVAVKIGGARVPIALRREIMRVAARQLYVSYGTTETAYVSIAAPSMHDEREVVGPPDAHATVEILRRDGSRASPGEVGEILLRTPGMATGYAGDETATRRHFREGGFMPGDLASFTPEGWLCLHGRVDDMMIMNSVNIFPAEIERVLESHPAVAAAAAFPIPSEIHGQIPVAAVELHAGRGVDAAELVAYARGQLGTRAPRRVEIVAALPRNPQGKVMRREIARRLETTSD
jgi:acyl-CoA synthetase (AMP-forming)/AMP-acid ligase II